MCLRLQNYNFFSFHKHKISLYPPQSYSHPTELLEITRKTRKYTTPDI